MIKTYFIKFWAVEFRHYSCFFYYFCSVSNTVSIRTSRNPVTSSGNITYLRVSATNRNGISSFQLNCFIDSIDNDTPKPDNVVVQIKEISFLFIILYCKLNYFSNSGWSVSRDHGPVQSLNCWFIWRNK